MLVVDYEKTESRRNVQVASTCLGKRLFLASRDPDLLEGTVTGL